jgi:hypothetical protein
MLLSRHRFCVENSRESLLFAVESEPLPQRFVRGGHGRHQFIPCRILDASGLGKNKNVLSLADLLEPATAQGGLDPQRGLVGRVLRLCGPRGPKCEDDAGDDGG